jgi:hypothetical protein
MSNIIIPFRGNLNFCTKFNCESLLFDGMDDYLNAGILPTTAISAMSYSFWTYRTTLGTNILMMGRRNDGNGFWVGNNGGKIIFQIQYGTADVTQRVGVFNNLPFSAWTHIVCVYDGSLSTAANKTQIYVNGVNWSNNFYLQGTPSGGANLPSSLPAATSDFFIGGETATPSYATGNIDEAAVFDYPLTQQNVTDIYKLGKPTDLSLLSTPPTNWYRMGDNGSFKTPQWLIPSNENKDKVSNYSYEFQGINSRQIDVGTVNVGTTNITSMWLKRNVVSTQQTLLGGSSATSPTYHMLIFTGNDFYVRYSPTVFVGWTLSNVTTILNDTINWINIVVVRTGDTVKLHLNGDDVGIVPDSFGGGTIGALNTQFTDIGADINGTFPVNGIVNNIAAWNVDTVLPSDIYNGGTPPDLTTLPTAPVNWWKMGEDATLVYTVNPFGAWNIPDSVGSNDGTTNTTSSIFARIGEAPNSTNNALSINMDFVDVVLDTPPT